MDVQDKQVIDNAGWFCCIVLSQHCTIFVSLHHSVYAYLFFVYVFFPRNAMHKLSLCCCTVCVRPSVTLVYSVEINKDILNIFSESGNHTIRRFSVRNLITTSRQRPINGASNPWGYEKNHDFRPISRFILEMIQDKAIVATCIERKQELVSDQSSGAISNDANSDYKVTPLFDAEYLRNGTRYTHTHTVIMEDQQGLIHALLKDATSNDLE